LERARAGYRPLISGLRPEKKRVHTNGESAVEEEPQESAVEEEPQERNEVAAKRYFVLSPAMT
jgi:hypothetical protein